MKKARLKKKSVPLRGENNGLWIWITLALSMVLIVAWLGLSIGSASQGKSDVAASYTRRTRLAEGQVTETGYYTDNIGWLGRGNTRVLQGMRYFYQQTGAQPYLYLTSNLGSAEAPDSYAMRAYAEMLYETLFRDQGHVLLLIYRNELYGEGYLTHIQVGSAAASVMDQEAVGILQEYLDSAFENTDLYPESGRDRMFSDIFRNTAWNIMGVRDNSGWFIALAVILLVMGLIIVIDFRRAWRRQKKERDEEKTAFQTV